MIPRGYNNLLSVDCDTPWGTPGTREEGRGAANFPELSCLGLQHSHKTRMVAFEVYQV